MAREQSKAAKRRFHDGNFHNRFFAGKGIDIGGKPDPLANYIGVFPLLKSCKTWDLEDGDAQYLKNVPDNSYDFLVSSHSFEHMKDLHISLQNWIRVVKKGGYLIITVPDEDMYEMGQWPSRYNSDHKWTFTVYKPKSWSPKSVNLLELFIDFSTSVQVERIDVIRDFFQITLARKKYDQTRTPVTESAIEIILRKY
ncbi:MAG: class I SAM-dependent methyltransferase [Epsilonproteobacteria bacterium]|nr:class I SAM-dependent methyltransferase [Campylobacterota bacterium]